MRGTRINMSCSTTFLQTEFRAGFRSFTSTWLSGNCRLTAVRGEPDAWKLISLRSEQSANHPVTPAEDKAKNSFPSAVSKVSSSLSRRLRTMQSNPLLLYVFLIPVLDIFLPHVEFFLAIFYNIIARCTKKIEIPYLFCYDI